MRKSCTPIRIAAWSISVWRSLPPRGLVVQRLFFFFFINVIKVVFILSLSSLPLSYTYSTLSFLSNTLYPEGTIYTSCYVSFSFFNSARVRWKNACSAPRFIKAKSLYYSISASGWEWKIFMLNNYFSYLNILFSNCHKLI